MEKEIIWSEFAVRDIREIYNYIRSDSLFYADRILDEIVNKSETLSSLPMRGRTTPEIGNPSIREIFVKQYRLIYEIEERRIVIHNIIHMARDYEAMLKE
ncbi:MAG: type II toxin-antitoxin system RelE/ParE family toxin [Candidatus Kapaibacterium sp.]